MENNHQILDEQFQEDKPKELILASRGKRFANYIIDRIVFYILILGLAFVAGIVFGPETLAWMEQLNRLEDILLTALLGVVYYAVSESLMNGRTVGKLITKTRVVDEYGQTPDFTTTFRRSLCRFVPFDAFSFLGDGTTGWHDRWSDTRVIEAN